MESRRAQIGQFFHPAAFIHDTEEGIAQIEEYISEYQIGGLTFFYSRESVETNFNRKKVIQNQGDSIERLAELIGRYQKISSTPLLISIDAEWGLGMRIASHPPFPYPLTLAAANDAQLCYEVGKAIAQELKAIGIHFNLAPVLDVNVNPDNPVIGYRSFGEDPKKVLEFAQAYYNGLKSEGILGCLKHFPGHGDTTTDSHLDLPVIRKNRSALDQTEFFPFKEMIKAGVDCIMTGHLIIEALDDKPCSLSKKVIENFLRDELSHEAAVMTDALNMKSVFKDARKGELEFRAFEAGNDILSFSQNLKEAIDIIDGEVDYQRIEKSYDRVKKLKGDSLIGKNENEFPLRDSTALRTNIANKTITILKNGADNDSRVDRGDTSVISVFKNPAYSSFVLERKCSYHEVNQGDQLASLSSSFSESSKIIISFYPPSYKPNNGFGIPTDMLDAIHQLANKISVDLYLFGNPYSSRLFDIDHFQSVVLAYQDLNEYEKAAADYANGKLKAAGKSPVTWTK